MVFWTNFGHVLVQKLFCRADFVSEEFSGLARAYVKPQLHRHDMETHSEPLARKAVPCSRVHRIFCKSPATLAQRLLALVRTLNH